MQFFPISDLIKEAGGQYPLAAIMGVRQNQISRWKQAGAYVSEDGRVFPPSPSEYNPPLHHLGLIKEKSG